MIRKGGGMGELQKKKREEPMDEKLKSYTTESRYKSKGCKIKLRGIRELTILPCSINYACCEVFGGEEMLGL